MKYIKRLVVLLINFVFLFALCGCSGGIKSEDAKKYTGEYFKAISTGDFEKLGSVTHPNRKIFEASLEGFVNAIESEYEIDFSKDATIEEYTGFSSSLYDSEVGGAKYTLEFKFTVDNIKLNGSTDMVSNESGIGITNFYIEE